MPDAFVRQALEGERLPCAVVDLDAVDRNVDRLKARLSGKTLRMASKSLRHMGLMRRIQRRGGAQFQGVMCFTVPEATALRREGFDDLLVAYPTLQHSALTELAAQGGRVSVVVDCAEHVQALGRWARGGRIAGCGHRARRQLSAGPAAPGRSQEPRADRGPGALAGPPHPRGPGGRAGRPDGLRGPCGRCARRELLLQAPEPVQEADEVRGPARLRREVVQALRREGFALSLVNGGGTGSLHLTAVEEVVTEVTAGSGFVCSHLFSGFADLELEPAAWFACEVVRSSDPSMVTCLGGGYVASGEPGWDKVPVPVSPPGLAYVSMEGAGEVQTPLTGAPPGLRLGESVLFRHAKAGELAERFNEYLLVREGRVVAREPTYRGQGLCFL